METWTAGQIGSSSGAYSGRTVTFTCDGESVSGTLTRSDWPTATHTMLIVGSRMRSVPNTTPVEVA